MREIRIRFLRQADPLEKGMANHSSTRGAYLVAQMVKNLPEMWETWVWALGQEEPLDKGMATSPQYSCLENLQN